MTVVTLYILGLVLAAVLAGSIVFFSCVVAPLIFIKLDGDTAGKFVRNIFPWYYLLIASVSALSAACLFHAYILEASILSGISVGAIVARQILMPWINRCRDNMLSGIASAERSFKVLHGTSVWINILQLIGSIAVLVLLGYNHVS